MWSRSLVRTVSWLILLLPLAAGAQAPSGNKAPLTTDSTILVPTFYAHAWQVIVAVEVWDKTTKKGDDSWIPEGALAADPDGGASVRKVLKLVPPPARGLTVQDFHVFDNGVEARINYFKEADFPVVTTATGPWSFDATTHGVWGTLLGGSGIIRSPYTDYLIGYVPPALRPGECRSIQIVVPNHTIWTNRTQYCAAGKADAANTLEETELAARLQRIANSSKPGAMEVSVRAFTFWSSGVLSLAGQTPTAGPATALPPSDFTYIVEVHDSEAPATVQVATQFGFPFQLWDYPCKKSEAINILGLVYNEKGELAGQFEDTFRCDMLARTAAGKLWQKVPRAKGSIPTLFDTQIELRPGEYELRVAVTDGKKFGRARVPLRVQPLNAAALTVSNVVLNGVLRDTSWILRDATDVAPNPIVPTPLVSKDVQFLPMPDTHLSKGNSLSAYFEIYEPLLETNKADVSYSVRITDLKTGTLMMNTGPLSAADWVVPGNAVIPIGLKIAIEKLPPGPYRVELQASDSARRESEWRQADFSIE
jgi:hypothetical protein